MKTELRRPEQITSPKSMQIYVSVALSLVAAAATAIGCAWPGTSHSVRFNGFQTERAMGRLPPLPTMANGLNELRVQWDVEEAESEDDYTVAEDETKKVDALWDRADTAEKNGDLRLDRDLLNEYLK